MEPKHKNILILLDPRGWFWKKYNEQNQTESLDIALLSQSLESAGYSVVSVCINDLDFYCSYQDQLVLYASSEDFNGGTKSFIEDILLWLELQGATLIPAYRFLRAHHNKVMMELLRNSFSDPSMKTIHSEFYPSRQAALDRTGPWPVVVKSASGAGSQGVALAQNRKQLATVTRQLARLSGWDLGVLFYCRNLIRAVRRQGPFNYHNAKLVIQNFLPGLSGDYKVLAFSGHYFVLHRQNRQNDFRASGSGHFVAIDTLEIEGVLNFAKRCTQTIDSPFISMDIGFDGAQHHLIEFQCVSFGLKALTLATGYYECDETGHWHWVAGQSRPEVEFAKSLIRYLQMTVK